MAKYVRTAKIRVRKPLLSREIITIKFSWDDVLEVIKHRSYHLYTYFMSLSEEAQKEIMDEFEHGIKKGLEHGMMSDWDLVMDSASDELQQHLRIQAECPYGGDYERR